MVKKENKALKYASLIFGIVTIVYMWLYDRLLEPNPLYGNRASTASNVGRDHWIAFIFWGSIITVQISRLTCKNRAENDGYSGRVFFAGMS